MPTLQELNKIIAKQARAANRRIERADAGQRAAIEAYQNRSAYSTGWSAERGKFKAGKATSVKEAVARLEQLGDFMASKTSTRRGWKQLKKSNVSKAAGTLENMGYDFTPRELETILKEADAKSRREFYKVLDTVQAYKDSGGGLDNFVEAVRQAKATKLSESEALERRLRQRRR